MPRPARLTCPSCHQVLGDVTRDGVLTTAFGVRVTVPAAAAETLIVVCCCGARRPWDRRPPDFEVKAG